MKEEKKKKKDKKVEEIHLLDDKVKELEEKLLRNQAEVQNFKRRTSEEVSKMLKYKDEELVLAILPIIDNFERALDMDDKSEEITNFLEGFALIHQNLVDTLKRFKVEEIDGLHTPFNPEVHEAVITGIDKKYEKGIILEVMQKGYKLKDKIIRPAMVKVNEYEKGEE